MADKDWRTSYLNHLVGLMSGERFRGQLKNELAVQSLQVVGTAVDVSCIAARLGMLQV